MDAEPALKGSGACKWPTDDDVDTYEDACMACTYAEKELNVAEQWSWTCRMGKDELEGPIDALKKTAECTKAAAAAEPGTTIPDLNRTTRQNAHLLRSLQLVLDKEREGLGEKKVALTLAEAVQQQTRRASEAQPPPAVDQDTSNRKRSTPPSDDDIVGSKSAKVGAASAGAAARSGREGGLSAPAADGLKVTPVINLSALRRAVAKARMGVEEAEGRVTMMEELCKEHQQREEDKVSRVTGLNRAAAEAEQTWRDAYYGNEFQEACKNCGAAGSNVEQKRAVVGLAEIHLQKTKRVFYNALASGESGMAPSERVRTAMKEIASENRGVRAEPVDVFNCMPERKEHIVLPQCHGVYSVPPSTVGLGIVREERRPKKEIKKKAPRGRAKKAATATAAVRKVGRGRAVGERTSKKEQKKEAPRQLAKEAAAAAAAGAGGRAKGSTGTALRRSARSSRGKPAEVFEA